ncbi:MAG TPA: very short patch repair endonuclease [Roseimicrobium sp.]|nr:very short patch repair endonuclease [Roseimicrobium sp.]
MADIFSDVKRSAVMAAIRGKGNKDTELRMMVLFREHGITGWRRGQVLMGKPDFVFRKERVVVFVDGCFWHGCPKPKHAPMPKTRAEWWAAKLERNKMRDRIVNRSLRKEGWTVVRVWECDLARKHWPRVARRLARALGRTL